MFNKRKEEKPSNPSPSVPPGNVARRPTEESSLPSAASRPELRASSVGSRSYPRPDRSVRPARSSAPGGGDSTVMHPHLSFHGEVKYSGTLTIDCEFRGSVVTDDTVIVGPSAKVEAEIRAGVVEISGKVHGDVHATQRVKIFTGGEVYGNIETPTIGMEDGVVFEGSCTRPQDTEVTSPPKSSPSTVAEVLGGGAGDSGEPSDTDWAGEAESTEASPSTETESVGQP